MFPAFTVSLACLVLTSIIGIVLLLIVYETKRRKIKEKEKLKRRIKEITGQDFVKGYTTVKDLEKMYRKKG